MKKLMLLTVVLINFLALVIESSEARPRRNRFGNHGRPPPRNRLATTAGNVLTYGALVRGTTTRTNTHSD